jgi:hypothetical protein
MWRAVAVWHHVGVQQMKFCTGQAGLVLKMLEAHHSCTGLGREGPSQVQEQITCSIATPAQLAQRKMSQLLVDDVNCCT